MTNGAIRPGFARIVQPLRSATPSHESESAFIEQLRANDPAACEAFVRRHTPHLYLVARRFLRCEHDAADAVQEAFQLAFHGIATFYGHSELGTWLHRILVNVCLMKLRTKKSRPSVSIDSLLPRFDESGHRLPSRAGEHDSPSEQLNRTEVRRTVRDCIDRLPEPYRTVLMLRDIEELDTRETADRLGISVPAVKVRLHRARQALRTLLEPVFRWDGGTRHTAIC